MSFTVAHQEHHQTLWAPVEVDEVVYTGSIIGVDVATPLSGVQPYPAAEGSAGHTNLDIPLGVVVGNNNVSGNISYNSTYKAEYITGGSITSPYGSTTQFQGAEGPLREQFQMVEYIPITAETVLRGPIFNSTYGNVIAEVTAASTTGGDGYDFTTSAALVATVIGYNTMYCRTGANKGIYRILATSDTVTHTWTPALKAEVTTSDKFIILNGIRPFGMSRAYIHAEGMHFDASAALTANYLFIDVIRLDLEEAGNEYVEFRFSPVNFIPTDRST